MPYKIDKVTGEMSEYIFDFGGIVALRNFTARTSGERLIIQSATNANFTILDALVSEVEIDGVVYDTPQAAQEALQRLVFNPVVPVIMTLAERLLLQGALQKGSYTGTAQDLKTLIDGKSPASHTHAWGDITDKPTLFSGSYNDLTDKPAPVDVSHLLQKGGYIGTAQDLKTALDNILAILQSDDTELDQLQEIVNYIKQNKKILGQLGIPNIAGLVDALSGKAPLTHTHAWDDITGKPAFFSGNYNDLTNKPTDLATETFVSTEIGKLKIGGRNLILKSSVKKENQDYLIAEYPLSQNNQYINGEEYTITIWGNLNPSKKHLEIYNSSGSVLLLKCKKIAEGIYGGTFNWNDTIPFKVDNTFLQIYQMPNAVNAVSSIEKIKLEKGNFATDWSPAPEDIFAEITTRQLPISQSVTTSALINGFSQNGRTMVSTGTNEIVVTIDSPDGFSASYQKGGLGNISFVVGSGKTLVQVDGTNVISGAKGSTATISVIGNEILLRISNV